MKLVYNKCLLVHRRLISESIHYILVCMYTTVSRRQLLYASPQMTHVIIDLKQFLALESQNKSIYLNIGVSASITRMTFAENDKF